MASFRPAFSTCTRWFAALILMLSAAQAAEWPKVNKAELAETSSKIEPGADAEYLLRETTMERFTFGQVDSNVIEDAENIEITKYYGIVGMQDKHYARLKIFTEKGAKAFSKLEIPHDIDAKISGLAARIIKPDGAITEVKQEDFKDEDVGRTTRKKTYAPQGLIPGSIVEYSYVESSKIPETWAPLYFQSKYPARRVVFKVAKLKPPPGGGETQYEIRTLAYNTSAQSFSQKGKHLVFEQANVPSIRNESFAPAPISTEMVIILYLQNNSSADAAQYWAGFGRKEGQRFRNAIAATPAISTTLDTIISATDSDDQKLTKIHDWCRNSIVNRGRLKLSKEERERLKPNNNVSEVLEAKSGTSSDINLLFGALASAAGFDVRLAALNNRKRIPFNRSLVEKSLMLPDRAIAVSRGADWRFFNPGATFLAAGLVLPQHGDTYILICDPNGTEQPARVEGPSADASVRMRKGDFTLGPGGTLEGDVTETYTGLVEYTMKNALHELGADEQATKIKRQIQRRIPSAEVSAITVANAASPAAPLSVNYHLRIPDYAQVSDKGLIFQPAVFLKGQKPLLRDGERKFPLVFPFRLTDRTEVHIKIPEGFAVETGPAPQGIDAVGLGSYDLTLRHNMVAGEIVDIRDRSYTGFTFKAASYAQVKAILDQMQRLNAFTMKLTREGSAPDGEPTPQLQAGATSQTQTDAAPSSADDEDAEMAMLL